MTLAEKQEAVRQFRDGTSLTAVNAWIEHHASPPLTWAVDVIREYMLGWPKETRRKAAGARQ